MQELYKKIMEKPKAYRRKLAYILTIFFGLIIVSIWMLITMDTLKKDFNQINPGESFKKELPSLKEKYREQTEEISEARKELENLGY